MQDDDENDDPSRFTFCLATTSIDFHVMNFSTFQRLQSSVWEPLKNHKNQQV